MTWEFLNSQISSAQSNTATEKKDLRDVREQLDLTKTWSSWNVFRGSDNLTTPHITYCKEKS